jgi:hypothetical protein
MAKVKHATMEDLDTILELLQEFVNESDFTRNNSVGPEEIKSYAEFFIDSPEHLVLVWDGGVFCAGVVNGLFTKDSMVSEIVFYVKKEKRGRTPVVSILKTLEAWTSGRGIKKIVFHLIGSEPKGEFLEKRGYTLCESSFMKEVGD